jgi:hypothetical protein
VDNIGQTGSLPILMGSRAQRQDFCEGGGEPEKKEGGGECEKEEGGGEREKEEGGGEREKEGLVGRSAVTAVKLSDDAT